MKAKNNEQTRVHRAIYGPRIRLIRDVVAAYHNIEPELTQKHTRKGEAIRPRQVIHYLCREFMPRCPLHIIGLVTGNGKAFDHASVSYNSHKIADLIHLKDRTGRFIYPDMVREVGVLKVNIARAMDEAKMGYVKVCEHCGNPVSDE